MNTIKRNTAKQIKIALEEDIGNEYREYLVLDEDMPRVPVTLEEKITEIVSFYDIMNFQDRDLEDNEYDIEVRFILGLLRRVNDVKELQWMIYDVFLFCLGQYHERQNSDRRFKYIAEEIWEAWQEEVERLNLKKSTRIFGKGNNR